MGIDSEKWDALTLREISEDETGAARRYCLRRARDEEEGLEFLLMLGLEEAS